jgi:hypothetical protein
VQLNRASQRGRRVAAAALTLSLLSSLAACGTGQTSSPEQVEKNQAQWSMPLDEFRVFSPELSNYAEQLLISPCLVNKGYEWPVPWRNTNFPLPPDFNHVGYRLFNEGTASRWGYHFAPGANDAELKAWALFVSFSNSYAPDRNFDGAFQSCADAARDEATVEAADGYNYISDLATQARDVATQSESVVGLLPRWQECLQGRVSFSVPADPWAEMPPAGVASRFGLDGSNKTLTPSQEEIDAAVADAECRASTGLSTALYDAEWDQQAKLVTENRDQLERFRSGATELNEKLLTVVAEHAPAAP